MIYYIIPYLVLLISTPFYKRGESNNNKFYFLLASLPAFIVASFRGNVGTDTHQYLIIINDIINKYKDFTDIDTEVLFFYLTKILSIFTENEKIILSIITVLYCTLYFIAFSKNKENILISIFFIFPLFFYDSSMNGIRYGISFAFAKIAFDAMNDDKIKKCFFLLALSISFHLSGLILFASLSIKKLNAKLLITISLLLIFILYASKEYLIFKLSAYSSYSSPNPYSGISLLIISTLLLLHTLIFYRNELFIAFFCFSMTLIFFAISIYSYAGLRFIYLLIYCFFIFQIEFLRLKNRISILNYLSMFLISIICFLIKLRHFILYTDGDTPFLPYNFLTLHN